MLFWNVDRDLLFLPFLDRWLESRNHAFHLACCLSFIRRLESSRAIRFHLEVRVQTGDQHAGLTVLRLLCLLDAGQRRCCNRIGLLMQEVVRLRGQILLRLVKLVIGVTGHSFCQFGQF